MEYSFFKKNMLEERLFEYRGFKMEELVFLSLGKEGFVLGYRVI